MARKEPKRRRFFWPRFSLWAMLVLVTVVAIPLGYVAQRRSFNLRRLAACELLESKGVILNNLGLNDELPPVRGMRLWMRRLLLEDVSPLVCDLCYDPDFIDSEELPNRNDEPWRPLDDHDLETLTAFPELQYLELHSLSKCTDRGLEVIRRLPKLTSLQLYSAPHLTGSFLRDLPGGCAFLGTAIGRINTAGRREFDVPSSLRSD